MWRGLKGENLYWRAAILGALMIVVAFLWYRAVVPRILKIPDNFSYSADVISVDNFYDEAAAEYRGEEYSQTTFSYAVVGNTNGALRIKNTFDVHSLDGKQIFKTEPVYTIDPFTGAHILEAGETPRTGYLFAPRFLTKGKSFTYWHASSNAPGVMRFVDEEELYGLTVYKYETNYGGPIDQTAQLAFLPGVGTSKGVTLLAKNFIWVEPVTGYLVKQEDYSVDYYFYDLRTGKRLAPYNQFLNTYSEQSVQEQVATAAQKKFVTLLVVLWIPLFALLCFGLAIFHRLFLPERLRQNIMDHQMSIGVFLVLSLLTLTGYTAVKHSVAARQEQEYGASVDEIAASLRQRFGIYLSELASAKAMFDTVKHVERRDWERYVASLDTSKNFPGTVGIAYTKMIAPKEKTAFEANMRAQGFPDFSVKPGGQRSLYSSVIYIESRNPRTHRALGFDMLTDASRRQAMFLARDTGAVAMTSRVTLLSEDEVNYQPGFILISPVYREGVLPSTALERRANIDGFLMTAFRIKDFMNGVIGVKNYQVDFRIYDGLKVGPDSFIYDFDGSATMPQNQPSISFRKLRTMYIQGHPWTIEFVNRDAAPAHASDRLLPAIVGWGGMLASVLVTAMVYFASTSKRRAVAYAEALHANLQKSQQDLLERNRAMEEKIAELDTLNRFMVERELRMIELKAENARLRTMDGGHL